MPNRLQVISGPDEGQAFPLPASGTLLIGRSAKKSAIRLHDLYVSRTHCRLEIDGDRILLADQEKSKGTFVNDRKIIRQELQPGDVIRVGKSRLRLEKAGGGEAELPAPAKGKSGRRSARQAHWVDALVNHELGRFEIGPLIGRGHFGAVFRARDRKKGRVVALKVLSPTFPKDDREKERFIRAMKAMLPLRHPNLVSVYGAGKTGPHCWIAKEYVAGKSLARVIEEMRTDRPIRWRRAFRVAVQIGRALDFARGNRLIHRNITSQNILWLARDKVAKLNDLKLMSALDGSELLDQTLEKKLLAELVFLSPEQAEADTVGDDLSEVYSLGVVIYALLTGRLPFGGKTPADTLTQICEDLPIEPRKLQPTIPVDFERVVLHMLAKNPEDRYQTPAELLADLYRIGEEEGVKV